jgi:hypothetical protein
MLKKFIFAIQVGFELCKKNLLKKYIQKELFLYRQRQANKEFIRELFQMSVEDAISKKKSQEWERIVKFYEKNNKKND